MTTDLKHCERCGENLAAFRFNDDSGTCRDCQRWHHSPPQPIPVKAHQTAITELKKNPAYKAYLDEWQLRKSQFGSVGMLATGYRDK